MIGTEFHWRVPFDHPALAGHFPGRPIVPGVLLLDHALFLAQAQMGRKAALWKIAQTKFLSPCGPGDALVFSFEQGAHENLFFSIRCAEREIASGRLLPISA